VGEEEGQGSRQEVAVWHQAFVIMNATRKPGARDLVVGGRYLHVNGDFVRQIVAIEGHTVYWRDQMASGQCSKSAFLKRCPSLAPSEATAQTSIPAPLPPVGEFTLRDEANALTAYAFRNGFIEDLHAGKDSPMLRQPGNSRISDDEMRRLMIESSEKLERLLHMKRSDPEEYDAFVRSYHKVYCRGWKRD
jgi:hypothetical protein